jgi:HAD superfamily hydrolase (TIGR01662 family)
MSTARFMSYTQEAYATEKRGLKLSDEDIAGSFGHLRTTWEPWGINDIDAAIEEADAIAKSGLQNVELYPDTLEVLEALHYAGKQLALITSSSHDHIQRQLEKYYVERFFKCIITAYDITHHKPHPEPLEKALQAFGGTKSQAVMIGDSDKDLGAANNAGIDSILFYPPEHKKFYDLDKLRQLGPTYIVDDFRKIVEIV